LYTWGDNNSGQLGIGPTVGPVGSPVQVNLSNVQALGTGSTAQHSLVIVKPPPAVPFASATAKLTITGGRNPGFDLTETFTWVAATNGLTPPAEVTTLQIGTYVVTFPVGSFKPGGNGKFTFTGVINGVSLSVTIQPSGASGYTFKASGNAVNLSSLTNPVP